MEDSAISAGIWMATVCDRFDATGDWTMKAYADKVWAGMARLSQLMVPDRPLSPDQTALLKHLLLQTDFNACLTYALFYPLAAYWRAVKRGML
jgi:hypothetical protein